MGICAIVFSAGLVSACGGGSAASAAGGSVTTSLASTPADATPAVAQSSDTAASTPAALQAVNPLADTTASSATLAEALGTISDVRTLGSAANMETTSQASSTDSAVLSADASGSDVDLLLAAAASPSSVSTLAVKTSIVQVKLTDEYHSFTITGTAVVRFGSPSTNQWVTKTVTGYGECSNAFFGKDPAYGVVKECQTFALNAPLAALASLGPVLSKANGLMPVVDIGKIPTPWIASNLLQVSNTSEQAPISDGGSFRTFCTPSHLSFDDPIVFPGKPGTSHLHLFFGNTGANANSTAESLRTTGTSSCHGGIANRSAYWVPAMIDTRTGAPVITDGIGTYYKNGGIPSSTIQPMPAGLRMIAGSPAATLAGASWGTRFKCIGGPNNENDKYGPGIGDCDVGASLIQEISFPQCWDGINLDSPDHKSHMAFALGGGNNNVCPSTHPVPLPQVTFNVGYTVTEKGQAKYWRLASDNYDKTQPGGYSSHGDWFNGWKSDISDSWAKNCIKPSKDCHSHLVGDGRMLY